MKVRWRDVLIAALSGILVVVLGGPQVGSAPRTDVLIIAKDISDIRTPDPSKSYDVGGVFLQFPVYSRLVRQSAPNYWKILPDLAESWTVSPDARVYTFKLRNATFHTGNPVTAEDVPFSLLRTKNIKGYGSFLAEPIKNSQVLDARTVRVELNQTHATLLAARAAGVFSLIDSKSVKAAGGVETANADKEDKAEQWFYTNSAGTGPYRLRPLPRAAGNSVGSNERYFRAKPLFLPGVF